MPTDWQEPAAQWRELLDAAGVGDEPATPGQLRLAPFIPPTRTRPWPLAVAHPLGLLHTMLGGATRPEHPAWARATLELRATGEIARTIWAVLLYETLELSLRVKSLADLTPDAQVAVKRVVGTLAAQFTLGTVPWLAGRAAALTALAIPLREHGLFWTPALEDARRSWFHPLDEFVKWPNPRRGSRGVLRLHR